MSVVIRLKVPTEMHYTVIPMSMGTSKVNSSRPHVQSITVESITVETALCKLLD